MADTFKDTPPDLKIAVEGVARFSDTLNTRDAKLRDLLGNANKVTAVLAKRSDQIASLVVNTNALLAELLSQRDSVDALMSNLTAVSHQISGFVNDNRTQLKPAVDKLNGVLAILDNRKKELQRTLYLLRRYAMSFGEVLGAGPFFKASLVNLAPGQFAQPFIDAAFSDLGLDPNVLLPSQLVDPGVGQPGTPALPVPYPRTGQGGEPHLTLPDAITGNATPTCPHSSPVATPTASRCLRHRLVGLRPGRPPWGLRQANCRRQPSGHLFLSPRAGAMMSVRTARIAIATTLVVILAVAITVVATPWWDRVSRNTYVAYFANTNGLYTGDEVRILGVAVGTVEEIDPQPNAAKVAFSVDRQYPVPADVQAAILSPSLVSARAIQLVPAYSAGPKLADGGTIPKDRTAVPVEWDDLRQQLEKLTDSLQPTTPGGPSPVGEFINSAAANLRGEGDTARDTVIKLSQAVSALGDHSTDIFSTVRNLQLLVSALSSSSDLLAASTRTWPTSPQCCPTSPTRWPMRRRASTAR